MKKWWIIYLLLSCEAQAIEAVVTVLETPLLKFKSKNAPVVQYLRKGDVIKIHPSVGNNRDVDKMAPDKEKYLRLKEKVKNDSNFSSDPLFFGKDEEIFSPEDEFIATTDRQGHRAYVFSKHIYIYFNDSREFDQKTLLADPTDYRLEEPLEKNYPIVRKKNYRNQLSFGITRPEFNNYDYPDNLKARGYSTPWELNYTHLMKAPGNHAGKILIGGSSNMRFHENSFLLEDGRSSLERGFKLGIGPSIGVDVYQKEKNRINFLYNIRWNFFDRLTIKQGAIEERSYWGSSFSTSVSTQYHRESFFSDDLDFIVGTNIEIGTGTKYRARNAGKNPSWWNNIGNDEFETGPTFNLSAFIGIQSEY